MKVWSLGDVVVDLLPIGDMQYQVCAGGAPANVAVGIAKLGNDVGFLGRVGQDPFGTFLKKTLVQHGVDCQHMEQDDFYKTSTVVVDLAENGERNFSFLVSPSADQFFSQHHLPKFDNDIFHFCSLALVGSVCRATVQEAIRRTKPQGIISFDINLRAQMWSDSEQMLAVISEFSHQADILKLSDDELFWLTQTETGDWQAALSEIANYPAKLIIITCGAAGSIVINGKNTYQFKAYSVSSVDTTGAGDAFVAGLLQGIVQFGLPGDDLDKLTQLMSRASACGALATTSKGALTATPNTEQLALFLATHQWLPTPQPFDSSNLTGMQNS